MGVVHVVPKSGEEPLAVARARTAFAPART